MKLGEVIWQNYKLFTWIFIIAYLCLAPADEFKKVHLTIPYLDKVVHFGMFLILALLIAGKGNPNQSKYIPYLFFFLAALYGGLIELAQYYITNTRSADWADWGADIIGVISGFGLFGFLPKWLNRLLV